MSSIEISDLIDVDSIAEEFAKDNAREVNKKHYVDNEELQAAYVEYHAKKVAAEEQGLPRPQFNDTIARAILEVPRNLIKRNNYNGYMFKEEMIEDAIENCVRYAHNYDPNKFENPFGYLTKMVDQSFKKRILLEKTQHYYKLKLFDKAGGFNAYNEDGVDHSEVQHFNETMDMYRDHLAYIEDFERKHEEKKQRAKEKRLAKMQASKGEVKRGNSLEDFL